MARFGAGLVGTEVAELVLSVMKCVPTRVLTRLSMRRVQLAIVTIGEPLVPRYLCRREECWGMLGRM